ncbi:DUF6894 family protein [Microvirga arabica]|uniref:DUF6894 family protein n=1 Tax=Microvirga arabica TaxID=1128671 RepID=A0ABV6YEL4_9HYPH
MTDVFDERPERIPNPVRRMRCYFHLVNSYEEIPDDEGIKVSDLEDAKAQALVAIEDIREEAVQVGASWHSWRLEITDTSRRVLASHSLEPMRH